MKVFVVIVTYNGIRWLKKCLGSLEESDTPLSVVVIDNASSDDTISFIKENFPAVNLIESNINLGFGQANNRGIKYAIDNHADYVFLLNQDAWIEPDTITKLLEFHHANAEYGIISPVHLNGNGSRLDGSFNSYLQKANPDFTSDLFLGKRKKVYDCTFINAAAWLVSRKCLEKVGGFDPLFFHYGEDENYCQRVIFHKMKIGVLTDALIYHDREDRLNNNGMRKEAAELLNWRYMIVKLSDINNNGFPAGLRKMKKQSVTGFIKNLLKLDFRAASGSLSNIRKLNQIKNDIMVSRDKNLKGSAHLQ
jgi:GT2 family glycosyltransferase